MNKIEAAITEYFGERCPEIAPGCPCCDAWIEYDTLVSTREKALREAYDSLFKHPGFIHAISGQKFKAVKLEDAAEGILALIEVKP